MLIYDFHTIGNKLLKYRKKTGMTQVEIAEVAGLSDRTYADIERGKVNMKIETLIKICDVLKITPNDILTEEDDFLTDSKSEILGRLDECPAHIQNTALKLLNFYIQSTN